MSEPLSALLVAEASLRANILALPTGSYATAGQNQFRTLWTRDFCHAARGFLALGEVDVVRDHLTRLLAVVRSDGLVPRVLDNRLVQWRVAYQVARQLFSALPALELKEPLKPQYTDEHGSHAIDSNLLVLMTALKLRECPGGTEWWLLHEEKLRQVWEWYRPRLKNGLIHQTPFSDWQDTVRREGVAFLTNFFYLITARRLEKLGWNTGVDGDALAQRLNETFFDPQVGLYRTLAQGPIVSLEGNLLAIEADEFLSEPEKGRLWEALLRHPLATLDNGVLGRCSHPEWPRAAVAWHAKLVGLERYHGGLAWSWLVGLSLKVALLRQDRVMTERLLTKIHALLLRDGEVVEVYDPEQLWQPWSSWLFAAERPFCWGAGYMLEALQTAKNTQTERPRSGVI